MDPNACYQQLLENLKNGDVLLADESCDAMYRWLNKGGDIPAALKKRTNLDAKTLAKIFLDASLVLGWAELGLYEEE